MPRMTESPTEGATQLMVQCPDRPGIVAAVSEYLYGHGANIVRGDQHSTGGEDARFFLRVEFDLATLDKPAEKIAEGFGTEIAPRFDMEWDISYSSARPRIAILCTREPNCVLELLRGRVDLIVLARYMQIVTPMFLDAFPQAVINIHHSFLPAFAGADPYGQAEQRGVKIIGATAHYATPDLDAGPIIEQDVLRVTHRDTRADLMRLGRELERQVLARAVRWHIEDRVLVYDNKTVVFH